MSGDGHPSSSHSVKYIRQGISIRLYGLSPIPARKAPHYLCGNHYFMFFLYTAVDLNSERGKKKAEKIPRKMQLFKNNGWRFPQNGDFYLVSPGFAVKG